MLLFLRMSIPPGLPWWEVTLGVLLCAGFTILCVGAAAKLFRIGILAQGQSPSLPKLVKWILTK